MHLVGYTIRIYHDARTYEHQIKLFCLRILKKYCVVTVYRICDRHGLIQMTTPSSRITKIGGRYPNSQTMSCVKQSYLTACTEQLIFFWVGLCLQKRGDLKPGNYSTKSSKTRIVYHN